MDNAPIRTFKIIASIVLCLGFSYIVSCESNNQGKWSYETISADPSYSISKNRVLKYNVVHTTSETRWLDVTNIQKFPDKVTFDHDFFHVTVHGDYVIETYYEDVPKPPPAHPSTKKAENSH